MEQQTKKLVIDISITTQEFEKKMDKSIEKLKLTEEELGNINELLEDFSDAFISFGTEAVKSANELQGALGKVENTFGKNSEVVKNFAQSTLNSFGMAQSSALEMAANFGDMGAIMGLNQEQAAGMSTQLVALAGDLASFKNVQLETASSALKGVFTGDTDALLELGIAMTDANLETFTLSQGIKETYEHMTEAEKAALRYGFVMDQTKGVQGDFAKNSGSAASQMLIFTESVKELYASFGEVLLPILSKGVTIVNQVIQGFAGLDPEVKKSIFIVGGLIAAVPLLTAGFEHATTIINGVKLAFTSLSLPMVALGVGIVAVTALIIKNWDSIRQTLLDTNMWSTFSNIFNTALGIIVEVIDLFGNILTLNWSGLWGNIINILKGAWNLVINIVAGAVKGLIAISGSLLEAFGLDSFAKAMYGFNQVIDNVAGKVTFNTDKLTNNAEKAKDAFSKLGTFDWKKLINGDGTEAATKGKTVLKKIFGDIKEMKIQCYQDLERDDTRGQLIDGKKIISQEKVNKEIAFLFENMGYNVTNGAANLQKKLENTKIVVQPFKTGKSEQQKTIDAFFESLETNFNMHVSNTTAFDKMRGYLDQGIKNSLDLDLPLEEALSNNKTAMTNFFTNFGYVFENEALFEKVRGKIQDGISKGLPFDKALGKVTEDLKRATDFWLPMMNTSLNFLADTLALGFESLFSKDVKVDFKGRFKKLLGGLLSSVGDFLIQYALKMQVVQTAMSVLAASLGGPQGWVAVAALLAIGAGLKGAGSAITNSASASSGGGGTNGSINAPSASRNIAPSYGASMGGGLNVSFEIAGTNLVGVLNNTNQAWGR
jgi:hypothetical protein